MKLNGWQRLWVFVSAPFFIGSLIGGVVSFFEGDIDGIGIALVVGIIWPMFLYAFGWGIAWVRRGFRGQ